MSAIMTVRAPDDLQGLLMQSAVCMGITRNALILQILWEWAESNCQRKGGKKNERRKNAADDAGRAG